MKQSPRRTLAQKRLLTAYLDLESRNPETSHDDLLQRTAHRTGASVETISAALSLGYKKEPSK
jgi:hypothetical protein